MAFITMYMDFHGWNHIFDKIPKVRGDIYIHSLPVFVDIFGRKAPPTIYRVYMSIAFEKENGFNLVQQEILLFLMCQVMLAQRINCL